MLTLHDLSCTRGERELFQGLGITIFAGSILAIRANNGFGKTTLLRVIAGLFPPNKGIIEWQGDDINRVYNSYRKSIVYLGHKNPSEDMWTVQQNLDFWVKMRSEPEVLLPVIHYLDLYSVLDLRFSSLSAGWKRRVSMAYVMSANASIWLLDEPFVNLDEETRMLCKNIIVSRAVQGGTVVLTDNQDTKIDDMAEIFLSDFTL